MFVGRIALLEVFDWIIDIGMVDVTVSVTDNFRFR